MAYASWYLNHAEHNYDAHKLEFLALKWAVTDHFHEYLYGAHLMCLQIITPLFIFSPQPNWMQWGTDG